MLIDYMKSDEWHEKVRQRGWHRSMIETAWHPGIVIQNVDDFTRDLKCQDTWFSVNEEKGLVSLRCR